MDIVAGLVFMLRRSCQKWWIPYVFVQYHATTSRSDYHAMKYFIVDVNSPIIKSYILCLAQHFICLFITVKFHFSH